ncbi:SAP domain-containing protein [Psidium guajava]|nr:SAP domain-containing protein [Psidium guajava]
MGQCASFAIAFCGVVFLPSLVRGDGSFTVYSSSFFDIFDSLVLMCECLRCALSFV